MMLFSYRPLCCWSLRTFLAAVLLLACSITLHAKPHPLTYSAVSIRDGEATIAAHAGIVSMLSAAINHEVRILVHDNNHTLVEKFLNNRIDIAYLGPLPYLVIAQQYPELDVLAAVNEESSQAQYRCVLVSAHDGPANATDIKGSIALTSPMSTCGYLTMADILARHDVDIENLDYLFIGSHEQVALGVIRGLYAAGGVKDNVAEKYQGLLLRVLDTTPPLPGFVLVVNRNSFSEEEVERMRTALLSMNPTDYQSWGVGKYGFSAAEQLSYEYIDELMTPEFKKLFMGEFDVR